MLIHVLLFLLGLFFLYIGAELLVGGSSRLALMLRISPIVVGLTVVAFGTSSPEFLVSFMAAYRGSIDVSVGNIVGSNIANIGLVLGFSALLRPIRHLAEDIRKELYWMLAASVIFFLMSLNLNIAHWEGALLFTGILVFTAVLIRQSMHDRKKVKQDDEALTVRTGYRWIDNLGRMQKMVLFLMASIAGIAVLAYGSKVTIDAATAIARRLGISEIVIGLTMVAFGTSLPELATGIISVIKKENEILVGNVIGSNLFNILGVAGPIALFFPIPMQPHVIHFDFPAMLIFSLFIFVLMWRKPRVPRYAGALLFVSYIAYIIWTFSAV